MKHFLNSWGNDGFIVAIIDTFVSIATTKHSTTNTKTTETTATESEKVVAPKIYDCDNARSAVVIGNDIKDFREVITDNDLQAVIDTAAQMHLQDINPEKVDAIISSMYYLDNKIDVNQLVKRCKSKSSLELVNTFTNLFGRKISSNVNVFSISEVITIDVLLRIVSYMCTAYTVVYKNSNVTFENIKDKVNSLIVIPSPSNNEMTVMENDTLEALFGKYLNPAIARKYTKQDAFYYMTAYYPNGPMTYEIDPNVLTGNGFNIILPVRLSNGEVTKAIVSSVNIDIISFALNNPGYIMGPAEYTRVTMQLFADQNLYKMIDMTTGRFIYGISAQQRNTLLNKLSLIKQFMGNNQSMSGRVRFEKYISPEEFMLVSDDRVKMAGPLCYPINKGLRFEVNGNTCNASIGSITYCFAFADASSSNPEIKPVEKVAVSNPVPVEPVINPALDNAKITLGEFFPDFSKLFSNDIPLVNQ